MGVCHPSHKDDDVFPCRKSKMRRRQRFVCLLNKWSKCDTWGISIGNCDVFSTLRPTTKLVKEAKKATLVPSSIFLLWKWEGSCLPRVNHKIRASASWSFWKWGFHSYNSPIHIDAVQFTFLMLRRENFSKKTLSLRSDGGHLTRLSCGGGEKTGRCGATWLCDR